MTVAELRDILDSPLVEDEMSVVANVDGVTNTPIHNSLIDTETGELILETSEEIDETNEDEEDEDDPEFDEGDVD